MFFLFFPFSFIFFRLPFPSPPLCRLSTYTPRDRYTFCNNAVRFRRLTNDRRLRISASPELRSVQKEEFRRFGSVVRSGCWAAPKTFVFGKRPTAVWGSPTYRTDTVRSRMSSTLKSWGVNKRNFRVRHGENVNIYVRPLWISQLYEDTSLRSEPMESEYTNICRTNETCYTRQPDRFRANFIFKLFW